MDALPAEADGGPVVVVPRIPHQLAGRGRSGALHNFRGTCRQLGRQLELFERHRVIAGAWRAQ